MAAEKKYDGLEIAIIGISGQFPGSGDYREYWQNLKEGRELIKTFTDEELIQAGVPEVLLQNKSYIKADGVVTDKDCFDHVFFGYSAGEATLMDPQIRLFHEHCWMALEDAGYTSLIDAKKIGMFAGASSNDNWKMYAHAMSRKIAVDPFFLKVIMSQNFISTLVSYKLNLRGPSYYVDTTCSTSLSAVHLACRSLLTRECAIALAGGVCISTTKGKGYLYQENMIASKDGHCRAFDKDASGAVAGEGIGIVVLKKLKEAINDGDHIYAVIRSTSVNNDGNHKVGYTAPSVKGQAECIIAAQKLAGISPGSISYIETHGTGTKLGDPVEIRGLNEAFGMAGSDKFCAIGSVKTNIGHLDAAAGVAGLIKTALCLKYRQLPASLHFKEPNPEIDFKGGPFYVNAVLQQWESPGGAPLRAGVSSLGIGGTNAHAILEEAPVVEESKSVREYKLLTLSAKTGGSLARYIDKLKDFLTAEPGINLSDMSYTLQTGRKHFGYRQSVVYRDREELTALLGQGKLKEQLIRSREGNRSVVFMFTGQGSQYTNMGRDLYRGEKVFREQMDQGFSVIEELTGEDFKAVLFSETSANEKINETKYTQPIVFLLEYSLARLLMSLGIEPWGMIGHSIGEYVAACISGVWSFEDALQLVVKRGELMNSLPGGDMISVAVTEAAAGAYLGNGISLAAVNAPEQVVFSGDRESMEELRRQLSASEIAYIKLHTSHAFHSGMQDSILAAFRKEAEKVSYNKPVRPFISNLTGKFIREEEAVSPGYWVRHLRETVKFSEGIKTLMSEHRELLFIEAGAGHSLTGLLKHQQWDKGMPVSLNMVRPFKESVNDEKYFTGKLGQLWSYGINIDWSSYYKEEKRRRVSLPTYSFEPTRYPAEVNPFEHGLLAGFSTSSVSPNKELKDWIYYPSWKRLVTSASGAGEIAGSYLFFSPAEIFSGSLKAGMLKKEKEWVEVLPGEGYEKISKNKYVLNPSDRDDFKELVKELKNDGIVITDIIYAWGIGVEPGELELEENNRALSLVYFSIVSMIQAFLAIGELKDKRMTVLTDRLHRVIGTEKINHVQSLQLGLVNVLPQEYGLPCRTIDLDLGEPVEELGEKLAAEINNNNNIGERIVALRHGHRWVQDYQKNVEPLQKPGGVIKEGGVYLVTGGLGNAGFVLSKYLAENYKVKLILTGRKEMGESTKGTGNEKGWERLTYLKGISKEVRYLSADVSDLHQFKSVVEEAEESMGHIDGVIHTAGVVDNSYFELVEDISAAKAIAMFGPKVKGIENIYEMFKDRAPDFVWITSSVSTILGGLGFGSYSSANLYMDHFVSGAGGELTNWKCVDLGGLVFTEEEAQKDGQALRPSELAMLFEWSLSVKSSAVIIENKTDLASRIEKVYNSRKEEVSAGDRAVSEANTRQERPDLGVEYAEASTETEAKLKVVFENFFGIENIGVEDDFFELGGDSLKGMMLLKRIKKEFNTELTLKEFLEMQNIRQISFYIDEIRLLLQENKSESREKIVI